MGQNSATYSLYQKWFTDNNVVFAPTIEAATADQIIPMVKNNLGIGFVPEEFLTVEESNNIFKISLTEELPNRDIILLKKENSVLNIAADKLYKRALATE